MTKKDYRTEEIKCVVEKALRYLFANDFYLIENSIDDYDKAYKQTREQGESAELSHVSERALQFRFAMYLQMFAWQSRFLKEYVIDCEYNRYYNNPKSIDGNRVIPDIIMHKRGDLENYCHEYYSVERYIKAYHGIIKSFPTIELQPERESDKILPPPMRRRFGRPRKNNRTGDLEEGPSTKRSNTITCSLCRTTGHNKRGCQAGPVKSKALKRKKNEAADGSSSQQNKKKTPKHKKE